MRARLRRTVCAGVLLSVVAGAACATARPAPPPELVAAVDPRCPLPLVWPSPEQTPRRVRIRNATADSLVVIVDRCFHYTTLASVPPGGLVQAALPPRLIGYPGGIRFHAYIESEARFVGAWHVEPRPTPSLELVLDSLTRVQAELFLYDALRDTSTTAPRLLEDGQGETYLMLPEVADGGFLIWSCGAGRRWISMSTGVKMPADTVDVSTRFDRGDWSPEERWEVLRAQTDAVLVPDAAIDSLTARVARAGLVNVSVVMRRFRPSPTGRTVPPTTTTFGFRTEGFVQRLGELSCYRDRARRLGG